MSLDQSIRALKTVAGDAKELFAVLKGLAEQDEDAKKAQKDQITKLADKLDEETRKAARARRDVEIEQLTEIIDAHEITLSLPGLSQSTRDAVRADRQAHVARRGRLRARAGTDLGGVLTKQLADNLDELVKKVKKDVRSKKKAAAHLQGAIQTADIALRIAGKLAI